MRRDSKKAKDIVTALAGAGVSFDGRPVTGRLLERLSAEGLLPLDLADMDSTIRQLRQLALLDYGPGKSADRTARVLLARGCLCERARPAMLQALGFDPDEWLGDEADFEGFLAALQTGISTLDAATHAEIVEGLKPAPGQSVTQRSLSELLASLSAPRNDPTREDPVMGGRLDYAGALIGPLEETPEEHDATHFETYLDAIGGNEVVSPCVHDEVAHAIDKESTVPVKVPQRGSKLTRTGRSPAMSYDEDEAAREVFAMLPTILPDVLRNAARAPLGDLSEAAQSIRLLAPRLLSPTGKPVSDFDADDFSATMAPLILALRQREITPPQPFRV